VAHCPRSNAWLKCGEAPVAELRRAGVRVGLGTDSLASNESLDMFAEMRAALAASERRARRLMAARAPHVPEPAPARQAQALTCEEVLRFATLGGAEALGLERQMGSLEPGKHADIIAVRLSPCSGNRRHDEQQSGLGHLSMGFRKSASSLADPVRAIVERATAAQVVMTMIGGVCRYGRDDYCRPGIGSSLLSDFGQEFLPSEVESAWKRARGKLGLPQ